MEAVQFIACTLTRNQDRPQRCFYFYCYFLFSCVQVSCLLYRHMAVSTDDSKEESPSIVIKSNQIKSKLYHKAWQQFKTDRVHSLIRIKLFKKEICLKADKWKDSFLYTLFTFLLFTFDFIKWHSCTLYSSTIWQSVYMNVKPGSECCSQQNASLQLHSSIWGMLLSAGHKHS